MRVYYIYLLYVIHISMYLKYFLLVLKFTVTYHRADATSGITFLQYAHTRALAINYVYSHIYVHI